VAAKASRPCIGTPTRTRTDRRIRPNRPRDHTISTAGEGSSRDIVNMFLFVLVTEPARR
jgi:hypothetical protein